MLHIKNDIKTMLEIMDYCFKKIVIRKLSIDDGRDELVKQSSRLRL